jgi:hypothetical protein
MAAVRTGPGTWQPGVHVRVFRPGGDARQTRERVAASGKARWDGSLELQVYAPPDRPLRAAGTGPDGAAKEMFVVAKG